ncbi:MAG TPA: ribosome-associated translation inhibitor RaiA [Verrucomicrobiae bacterium]|jgi:ribosomal subunit interface protein|nr:ribosome-associated translation inhibitor RaiA [Verrucomicrobiae bacterium]
MLQKFEIQGVHATVDDSLRKYVTKKIGGLDRYISPHNRESAHAEVHLKEGKTKNHNHCTCEATFHLPHSTIVVKESALNMYAAVDIVEAKLKQQLQKYKDLHGNGKTHRHLFARFHQRSA